MGVTNASMQQLLKHKLFNGWRLFLLVTTPVSVVVMVGMNRTDSWHGESVSDMIQLSVRCAVPMIYLAFSASSLHLLFPGSLTLWLMRNRGTIGLCFAAAMAWQLGFIIWLVTVYSDYYIKNVYVLRDAIEGVLGYVFLVLMTLTSFRFIRQRVPAIAWLVLHKTGIYFLWAYAFTVYWWALFYYPNPQIIDYLYFWGGFFSWGLRAIAWGKKRSLQNKSNISPVNKYSIRRNAGFGLIAIGILAAGWGSLWREPVQAVLTGHSFTSVPETYLPYWPFEPFLPILIIIIGVWMTFELSRPIEK